MPRRRHSRTSRNPGSEMAGVPASEINAKNHFYKVDEASDGLVAYWKFNEGTGNVINDVTNGYNVVANSTITWLSVSLPEK